MQNAVRTTRGAEHGVASPLRARSSARGGARGSQEQRRAFTLVELVIVLAIVSLLLALIVPATNAMFRDRKFADAETLLQGMLKTARADALRAEGVETGLLFYLDAGGRQRVVGLRKETRHIGEPAWENVFVITPERTFALPAPIRVVPRYAVEPPDPDDDAHTFSDVELANNSFLDPTPPYNANQRHRNVFSMTYAGDGQLFVDRIVLVMDQDADGDGYGDVTDMFGAGKDDPADHYFDREGERQEFPPLNGLPSTVPDKKKPGVQEDEFPLVIVDPAEPKTALNFPSVDGLLVYDDDTFREQTDAAAKRAYLLETARPYYVNRYSGEVIPGPRGEGTLSP